MIYKSHQTPPGSFQCYEGTDTDDLEGSVVQKIFHQSFLCMRMYAYMCIYMCSICICMHVCSVERKKVSLSILLENKSTQQKDQLHKQDQICIITFCSLLRTGKAMAVCLPVRNAKKTDQVQNSVLSALELVEIIDKKIDHKINSIKP